MGAFQRAAGDLPADGHHRAHRHLALAFALPGRFERRAHEPLVVNHGGKPLPCGRGSEPA